MATKLEVCCLCNNYIDCHMYKREWVCINCSKDCSKENLEKKILKQEINISSAVSKKSCRYELINFFKKNQNVVLIKEEIFKSLPQYKELTLKESLSSLVKEGHLFTRKVYIKNVYNFTIYSTNENLIKAKTKEEIKTIKKKKEKSINIESKSCYSKILKFFKNNPDKKYRSYELWDKFSGYNRRNIANALSRLTREGHIYSRKVYIKGSVKFALYSTTEELIKEPIEEEEFKNVYAYVLSNFYQLLTTKKLCRTFNITDTAIRKRLDDKEDIFKFNYLNRNFYFPVDKKDEMIEKIKKSVTW